MFYKFIYYFQRWHLIFVVTKTIKIFFLIISWGFKFIAHFSCLWTGPLIISHLLPGMGANRLTDRESLHHLGDKKNYAIRVPMVGWVGERHLQTIRVVQEVAPPTHARMTTTNVAFLPHRRHMSTWHVNKLSPPLKKNNHKIICRDALSWWNLVSDFLCIRSKSLASVQTIHKERESQKSTQCKASWIKNKGILTATQVYGEKK